jgi:sulfate transport system substrate-binding protein
MKHAVKRTVAAFALALGLAAPAFAADAPKNILNVSYDVSRELFVQLNPVFIKQWQAKTNQTIEIKQSHAGSSSQARSVLEGLPADVVTLNQYIDIQTLHDKGKLVSADWQKKFKNDASPYYSTPIFLVRKGNPWKIKDWDDLAKPGVAPVFPNPRTSGNGRYTYLAAWAYAVDKFGGDKEKAKDFVKKFLANVPVFDSGGRAATTTFAQRGIGDVLITFEAEAYAARRELGEDKFEVVTPTASFQADFPVAIVDKVVDQRGSREIATAYLEFLYGPEAQDILAKNYYRVTDSAVTQKYAAQFPAIKLITAKDLGGWDAITKEHFAAGGVLDQVFSGK